MKRHKEEKEGSYEFAATAGLFMKTKVKGLSSLLAGAGKTIGI